MTQLQLARQNITTQEMKQVAKDEGLDPEYIRLRIAEGKIVILVNRKRKASKVCGIGVGLKTKVNANIGTSADYADVANEMEKLRTVEEAGADAVMDLSTGGDLRAIRKKIIGSASIAVGSVPIYEAAVKTVQHKRAIVDMTATDMLEAVRLHCEDGVDFITVHCGATKGVLRHLKENKRICGVVSRGGTFFGRMDDP